MIAAAGIVLSMGSARAVEGIHSWAEIRAAFVKCWTVPRGTEGSVVAFQFLFAPDGGLRGPPRVLARVLKGDEPAKRAYEAAAYAALDRCLPFKITPAFKMVMGETLVLLRFVNTPREPALNLGSSMTIFAAEAKPE
ncbi:hypothetical protein MPEAHAMD_0525 [Methylobacterium frigidaeris]|uniref:TonB C-terminal domain-containing protein n=2 Tax=Methylobacterium frigidaeris TaxID=2038277 RepID=A0AA37H6P9_9HYPH|nr:hypothetical protein MPEAHAMD_0525 [Methylobacterium frigidaeris]